MGGNHELLSLLFPKSTQYRRQTVHHNRLKYSTSIILVQESNDATQHQRKYTLHRPSSKRCTTHRQCTGAGGLTCDMDAHSDAQWTAAKSMASVTKKCLWERSRCVHRWMASTQTARQSSGSSAPSWREWGRRAVRRTPADSASGLGATGFRADVQRHEKMRILCYMRAYMNIQSYRALCTNNFAGPEALRAGLMLASVRTSLY